MAGRRRHGAERADGPMMKTTARVLNDLVARRPRFVPALSIAGRLDLCVTTVRGALQDLVRRGLVDYHDEPSRFDDQGPARTYRAGVGVAAVDEGLLDRRGAPQGDTRERIYETLRGLSGPATLRELMTLTGLAETPVSKHLRAMLEEGRVQREQGPPPAVGSVRPWLWSVSVTNEQMDAAC